LALACVVFAGVTAIVLPGCSKREPDEDREEKKEGRNVEKYRVETRVLGHWLFTCPTLPYQIRLAVRHYEKTGVNVDFHYDKVEALVRCVGADGRPLPRPPVGRIRLLMDGEKHSFYLDAQTHYLNADPGDREHINLFSCALEVWDPRIEKFVQL